MSHALTPTDGSDARPRGTKPLPKTEFWNHLMEGVFGPRKGGARIIVDGQNASTGVAKTSCACALAQAFSKAFGYELSEDDGTLSGSEYLRRWREHPGEEQPSVIVLDELSGGGAADARRAMSNKNVNIGRSWEIMRKKRIVTITTTPHWGNADKKLRQHADYRVWCLEKPIGYFIPYKIITDFNDPKPKTKGFDDDRIRFPDMDAEGDWFYRSLARKKDELLESSGFDADATVDGEEESTDPDEVRRNEAIKTALLLVKPWDDDDGLTYVEAAEYLDYSRQWIGMRVREWRNGEHRDVITGEGEIA